MAWERLASTSADGSSTTLTTSTFTAKKNLRIIIHARSGAAGNYQVRFNADSGSNYATRRSYDGGSDGTYTSSNKFISYSATSALSSYMVLNITNISDQEKLVIGQSVENSAAGAGTAPNRVEFVGKWVNTSSQITSITILTNSGSNLTNDSYITVLGAKEAVTADSMTVSGGASAYPAALGSSVDGTVSGCALVHSATGGTDLTSSSQSWTQVGDEIVKTDNTITATSASDDGGGSTGSDRVYTALPSTLSNTKHTTDFDLRITGGADSGDPDIVPIMYTAGTTAFGGGSQDAYGIDMYSDSGSGSNYNMRLIARDGTDNDYSSGIVLSQSTQYYCRLERNSSVLGTLSVFSDSARTTHISGSPQTLTIASGSDRGADCTYLQSSVWSQSNETSYVVENVKLYNDKIIGDAKLTGSYSFDGTDDFVTFGSTSDFEFLHDGGENTVTFWMKKTTAESGDVRGILSTTVGSGNGMEVVYLDRSSSSETRRVKIEFTNSSGQQIGLYYAQEFFPNDTDWHFYAIRSNLSSSILKAYVDGVEKTADSSYPSFTGSAETGASSYALNIGRRGNDTFYFDGLIDDIGMWDEMISTGSITSLYASGSGALVTSLSDSKTKLKAYWNFDQTPPTNQVSSTVGFTAKKHLMIQAKIKGGNGNTFTFNNDTGNNYTHRYSNNGGSDGTQTSRANLWSYYDGSDTTKFTTLYVLNEASKEKLVITHNVSAVGTGAGTAPTRTETVGKWANTSDQITIVDVGTFTTDGIEEGSEVVVWGTD